jgi:DNA-binding transcriptional LysR family regulator
MDQLEAMRVFQAVADQGGFAAAARQLRISPSSATRALAALEEHVGAPLLRRSTRAVSLTEAGRGYLAVCRRLLAELDEADRAAGGEAVRPRGLLTITAPVYFGRLHVAPIVLEFLDAFADVRASLQLLDRTMNLIEEGIDVAIRIGRLPDSSLIVTNVGEVRRVVCGSPGYLAAQGEPESTSDLGRHQLIEMTGMAAFGQVWSFWVDGRETTVPVAPRLSVNQTDVAIAAALAGRGLTLLLSYQVAEYLRDGRLRAVLTHAEPPPIPINLVQPAARPPSAKVRAFVDFATVRLRARQAYAGST